MLINEGYAHPVAAAGSTYIIMKSIGLERRRRMLGTLLDVLSHIGQRGRLSGYPLSDIVAPPELLSWRQTRGKGLMM
jgi:hypothetical protein